jgi:hypothetical protein
MLVRAEIAARLRGHSLDRALIGGADPASRPLLAARAARLTRRATRAQLADELDHFARTEHEPRTPWRVLPSRKAAHANATELHALAAVLRGPSPVRARGVAMLRALLTDGAGVAYTDRSGDQLARELSRARAAVTG